MIEALEAMFQKMEKERVVPREWNEVKVKTVSKQGSTKR